MKIRISFPNYKWVSLDNLAIKEEEMAHQGWDSRISDSTYIVSIFRDPIERAASWYAMVVDNKVKVKLGSRKETNLQLDKNKFKSEYDHMRQFKFDHNDIKAFGILGVSVGLKWKKVQDKFKMLVKKYHPDINAGNKKYEEKLKLITLAYTQLKNTYRDKIDTKS